MAGDTGNCRRHLVDSTLMDLLRLIIRNFDHWLSHVEGVEPFTDDSQCILRIQIGRINHDLTFPDQIIRSDTCALFLHFWNEHMPIIPDEGANLSYGLKLERMAIHSMRLIAKHIQGNPALNDVQVIGGITTFISPEATDGGRKSFEHLGFTIFPYARSDGRVRRILGKLLWLVVDVGLQPRQFAIPKDAKNAAHRVLDEARKIP